MVKLLILVHLASTFFMTGLIWFVQIVHYPLYRFVGSDAFPEYENRHMRRTGYVVGPAMGIELLTAIFLPFAVPSVGLIPIVTKFSVLLLVGIWLITILVQSRQHLRLAKTYDARVADQLVLGNWVRTILWSARSLLLAWVVFSINWGTLGVVVTS